MPQVQEIQETTILTPAKARTLSGSFEIRALIFLALHIPVALLVKEVPFLATVYALGLLILGLIWVSGKSDPAYAVYAAAYLAGAEPLWRLGKAGIFWEYGKYAISLLLILALLRHGRFAKASKIPLLYFLLLVPSIFVMPSFDREAVSFNLSGPFLLSMAAMFFSTVRLDRRELLVVLLAMLAPIVGACYLSTAGTLVYEHVSFGASTRVTSAGYGPNQMSSMLGLGGLCAFLIAFIFKEMRILSKVMILAALWMAAQSALTYSRGGFWTLAGSILVAALYLVRERRYRGYLVAGGVVVALLATFVVIPWLESFTMGTLTRRFSDFEGTGREKIVKSDWAVFKMNPAFGVGPGKAYELHAIYFGPSSAHTEYSRMLAEHGLLGMVALVLLVYMTATRMLSRAGPHEKAVALSVTMWALLFMAHAAMRLAACSFAFGLGAALFLLDEDGVRGGPELPEKP